MPEPTFIEIVQQQARNKPQALAYRCGERRWTFADIEHDSNRIANTLAALGIVAGDRVAALTKFHVPALLLTLAAAKLGAVCMPVNWRLAPGEVRYIVDHGGAKLMLADRGFLPLVDRAGMPSLQQVVVTDGAHEGLPGFDAWFAGGAASFNAVAARPEDPLLQLYSSGTTGLPKGVVLSHAGLAYNCRLGVEVWGVTEASVIGNALPTFHIAGANMALFALYSGATGACYPDFDPAAYIAAIGQHGISHTFVVPAMICSCCSRPRCTRAISTASS